MLRTKDNVPKKIANIAEGLDVQKNGVPFVVQKLFTADGTFDKSIKSQYKEIDETEMPEAQKIMTKAGLTVTLPFTLSIMGMAYLGTASKAILASLSESNNIDYLKKQGYIKDGQEGQLIAKLSAINASMESGELCPSDNYSDRYTDLTEFSDNQKHSDSNILSAMDGSPIGTTSDSEDLEGKVK